MANVNVYRTSGSIEAIKKESRANEIIITSEEEMINDGTYEFGEVVIKDDNSITSLIVRDRYSNRIHIPTLRVAILKMLNHFVDVGVSDNSIVISVNQFFTNDEEITVTSTIEELCLTWFRDAISDPLSIIICDCEEKEDE